MVGHELPQAGRVFLLAPSGGLGGGIERYVETLESGFAEMGVPCHRFDLVSAGARSHLTLLSITREALRSRPQPTRLVVGHRALLPVATVLAREPMVRGMSVLCHGSESWGGRFRPRRFAERQLMRRPGVRVVAVSSFTAGTLAADCHAVVLRPGLSRPWFSALVEAGANLPPRALGIRLVTAFRLASWREKGLGEMIAALSRLGRRDVRLVVCGSGEPTSDLLRLVAAHDWCTVRADISDRELAHELAVADLFVLATRTRPGRRASGEGFGLVLLESQVAGTPVIVPAYGGSSDAYIEGVTGLAPTDESAEGLTWLLTRALENPDRLVWMGERAAEWARESFAPERYARLAVKRLL